MGNHKPTERAFDCWFCSLQSENRDNVRCGLLLRPYAKEETTPFTVWTKRGTRHRRPVEDYGLRVAWRLAKKRAGIRRAYRPHMLRDLMRTNWYRCGLRPETGQFIVGHEVDRYNYNQIRKAPEIVEEEWQRYREYVESGVKKKLRKENRELREKIEQIAGYREDLQDGQNRLQELLRTIEQMQKRTDYIEQTIREAAERENERRTKKAAKQ